MRSGRHELGLMSATACSALCCQRALSNCEVAESAATILGVQEELQSFLRLASPVAHLTPRTATKKLVQEPVLKNQRMRSTSSSKPSLPALPRYVAHDALRAHLPLTASG